MPRVNTIATPRPQAVKFHATAPRPYFAASVSSFSEASRGRFSPRSHWAHPLRGHVEVTGEHRLAHILPQPDLAGPFRRHRLDRGQAYSVEDFHRRLDITPASAMPSAVTCTAASTSLPYCLAIADHLAGRPVRQHRLQAGGAQPEHLVG